MVWSLGWRSRGGFICPSFLEFKRCQGQASGAAPKTVFSTDGNVFVSGFFFFFFFLFLALCVRFHRLALFSFTTGRFYKLKRASDRFQTTDSQRR